MKKNIELNSIFSISEEMVKDRGEDCFYHEVKGDKFIISVFDGCGGSGAKKYANYSGKTGAYIASRAVCGAVENWFLKSKNGAELKKYILDALSVCKKYADEGDRMRGSLGKAFPTTAAIITGNIVKDGIDINCYWAGDSRCYMLDSDGLHQLTVDDLEGQDAMSNLTNDGVMTNVINASTSFEIHSKNFIFKNPCILLTATDGCFGYLNTPMEFEYLLTSSLIEAKNPSEWKQKLNQKMHEVTGDDYTMAVAVCGFNGNFDTIQKAFTKRNEHVKSHYILSGRKSEDMWKEYKKDYNNYIK